MDRVSLRAKDVGAEPTLRGQTGWAHRPANAMSDTWGCHADNATRVPCNRSPINLANQNHPRSVATAPHIEPQCGPWAREMLRPAMSGPNRRPERSNLLEQSP